MTATERLDAVIVIDTETGARKMVHRSCKRPFEAVYGENPVPLQRNAPQYICYRCHKPIAWTDVPSL